MLIKIQFTFILTLFCNVRGHFIYENTNHLHPVHGLYVKPSTDGTTGDLYVAASENNGVKSQWLTDQPINFLPAAPQHQPKTVPVKLSSSLKKSTLPNEEIITSQKRAVITSPAIKYAYALPVPSPDGSLLTPYPYPIPASTSAEGSSSPCSNDFAQPYSPYFYPYMLSAIANAMNALKDNDKNDESSPTLSPLTPPFWPQTYTYPYQYVVVDPNAWAQTQSPPSTSTSDTSSENL